MPDLMLLLLGAWVKVIELVANPPKIDDNCSRFQLFQEIFFRNSFSAVICFLVGIVNQGPITMLFYGIFYALIIFLAPVTRGSLFSLIDWIFVAMEIVALIISTSIGSYIAGEWLGVEPTFKSFFKYWKENWKRFWPKGIISFKEAILKTKMELIFAIIIALILLILSAAIEVL